jgi:pimeloyl-ACP methyl ester carboxylesterase
MASIAVNGTTLYYELRGSGPLVLFISGATGDAGHWTEFAVAAWNSGRPPGLERCGCHGAAWPRPWIRVGEGVDADDVVDAGQRQARQTAPGRL